MAVEYNPYNNGKWFIRNITYASSELLQSLKDTRLLFRVLPVPASVSPEREIKAHKPFGITFLFTFSVKYFLFKTTTKQPVVYRCVQTPTRFWGLAGGGTPHTCASRVESLLYNVQA